VLLVATLGSLLLPASRVAGALGQLVAVGAVVAAVYSGAAWLSDGLASFALGSMAAAIGRYVVRQVVQGPPSEQSDVTAGPAEELDELDELTDARAR
jgi:hypothetical protein